jgi:hypothetical protein
MRDCGATEKGRDVVASVARFMDDLLARYAHESEHGVTDLVIRVARDRCAVASTARWNARQRKEREG